MLDADLRDAVREHHDRVLAAISDVLETAKPATNSEFAALVSMLERTETPHVVHSTHDFETYVVTVRGVVLFAFKRGRCERILTEP